MTQFVLSRVGMPAIEIDHDALRPQVGGQWEWCWATALPFRALVTPSVGSPMPAAPREGDDLFSTLGYWTALQGFLTYSFGWTRHDRGLRWWYDAGKPTDDPRLALIDAVWERDGLLLPYLEWVIDRHDMFQQQALAEWTDYDGARDELSLDWKRKLTAARATPGSVVSPYGKHLKLGSHAGGPAEPGYPGKLTMVGDLRGVYTTDSQLGWYSGLVDSGKALPQSARSVRVDVFTRTAGYLGTFRRSRATGLWFAGRHRYHGVGN